MGDRERCSEKVPDSGGWRWHQCKRYEWKDGFCKQHHPDTKAERDRKKQEVFDKRMAESPHVLKRRIADLERKLAELEAWRDKAFEAIPNLDLDIEALEPKDEKR